MPKLTRESPAVPRPRVRSREGRRGKLSRAEYLKRRNLLKKCKKRSKGDHGDRGDGDIRDALRKFTEEFCSGGAGRSKELVGRRRVPVQSEFRRRDPQWSRSGWCVGAGDRGGARRGARR